MKPALRALLRNKLRPFLRKAFAVLHPSRELVIAPYIELTCALLESMERGDTRRAIINMPPRSLKTFLCTKTFAAWLLARDPTLEIMINTCSEPLAKDIAYGIRHIMRSDFYREMTDTRIAKDRSSLLDFATNKGGQVFTRPIGASIIGRGADYIIPDDLNDIKDAGNADKNQLVQEQFEGEISSRFNDPSQGRMLVVAHRTSEDDISGYLLKRGSKYVHLCFPMVAPQQKIYTFGEVTWKRQKGDLLRERSYTDEELARKREMLVNPDFETLYQQNPGGELALKIEPKHFGSFDLRELPNSAPVMSIDAGLVEGSESSYSVVQVWKRQDGKHFLIDQWRGQVDFEDLSKVCRKLRKRHRPSHILIERSALGAALISATKRRVAPRVVAIVPDGRSKAARLGPHISLIRSGAVRLLREAEWRPEFVQEFITFPHSKFSDQVDATTQYLEWIKNRPAPAILESRAIVGLALFSRRRW